MVKYTLRRLLITVPVLVGVSVFAFGIIVLTPGDAATVILGPDATEEQLQALRRELGLDRPLPMQYVSFLWGAIRGDFGRSLISRRPVLEEIFERLPSTFELAVAAILFAFSLGLLLGVISAVYRHSLLDYLLSVVAILGISTPVFWLGLVLILVFAVYLRWFPSTGAGGPRALVLPALALGAASMATIARITRASILEVLHEDYVRTARAKGLSEPVVIARHVVRNALIPTVTVAGLQFGYLMGGAVVTETVFARPGLGTLLLDAIQHKDFPVVQGTVMLFSAFFVLTNLIVDLLYAYLDPRIRYG